MEKSEKKRSINHETETESISELSDEGEGRKTKRLKTDSTGISLENANGSSWTNPKSQNVRVVCRLRPLSKKEKSEQAEEKIKALSKYSTITVDKNRKYEYDAVFEPGTNQSEVYEKAVGNTIKSNIFKGFNVTILAYGQTGSGKTFTMGTSGGIIRADKFQQDKPDEGDGIIPRAVFDVFEMRQCLKHGEERVKVEMSYLEIYNEEARDLFSVNCSNNLHIRDSKNDGVYVQNLTWVPVTSPYEVTQLMESASEKRATAATQMNAVSSRSHAICTLNITIASQSTSPDEITDTFGGEMRSKLTLVDLAGSERIKRTGAEGNRMKEGININKGLFVLGQVVSSLSELGQNQQGDQINTSNPHTHVPYRDSKLTRLLQDSLGGNSRTVLVACVSPADSNVEESINTLRYAQRARNIKNSVTRNIVATSLSPEEAAMIRKENQMLKMQVIQLQSRQNLVGVGSSVSLIDENIDLRTLGLNIDKLEVVTKLRTKCALLESKIEQLEKNTISNTEDALEASLKADFSQLKLEQLYAKAKSQGLVINNDLLPSDHNLSLVEKLRIESSDLKSRLREAIADAAVARATAAAVVASDGNLTCAEEKALVSDEIENHQREIENNNFKNDCEKVAKELVVVSGDIEQKEAMAKKLEKERQCMDVMRSHFEEALQRLHDEVKVLTKERDAQLSHKVVTSGMHLKIKDLEKRIKELKEKASEHKKSLRMREIAEKKCAQLTSEIKEDKKRRAALQRRLKKDTEDRRSEQKAAKQQATRLLRNSQKLKLELQKVKDAAARQAAVLRRKAAEALSRQKKFSEKQRKRNNALLMKAKTSNSRSVQKNDNFENRKEELIKWLEREIEASSTLLQTRNEIEEQITLWENAVGKRDELSTSDVVDNNIIRTLDNEIETRSGIIKQLEKNEREFSKTFKDDGGSIISTQKFQDNSTWNNLSRSNAKFLLSKTFQNLVEKIVETMELSKSQKEAAVKASDAAIAVERRNAKEMMMKMRINHSESMAALLESTKSAVEEAIRIKNSKSDGTREGDSSISLLDDKLRIYLEGCNKIGESVKDELQDVRKNQDGMKKMLNSMTNGCVVKKKVAKKKWKKNAIEIDESFLESEEDEDDGQNLEDSDDSDWSPDTPARKKTEQISMIKTNQQKASKIKLNFSEGNESAVDDSCASGTVTEEDDAPPSKSLDTMKVVELKEMLRQRGLMVSGRKSELIERLRISIKNAEITNEEIKKDNLGLSPGNSLQEIAIDKEMKQKSEKEFSLSSSGKHKKSDEFLDSKREPFTPLQGANIENSIVEKGVLRRISENKPLSTLRKRKMALGGDVVSASKSTMSAVDRRKKRKNITLAVNQAFLELEKLQESEDTTKRQK